MTTGGAGGPKTPGGEGKTSPQKPKGQATQDGVEEPWHRDNPSPVAAWAFPTDTATKVFFPIEGGFNNKFL